MKICIVTLQYTNNFGALIQAKSLQSALECRGHTVSILNYAALPVKRIEHIWQGWGLKSSARMKEIEHRWLRLRHKARAIEIFDQYREANLNLTAPITREEDAVECLASFDAVVVGSDQVWNAKWFHPIYFLGYRGLDVLKISYAASAGSSSVKFSDPRTVAGWLSEFRRVSVRDYESHALLKEMGVPSSICCDPTVLTDDNGPTSVPASIPDKFLLTYFLHRDSSVVASRVAKELAARYDIPIVNIVVTAHETMRIGGADHYLANVGPSDWLGMIKKAAYVCTDSFHGSLIAAKYGRPLVACVSEAVKGARLIDAATRYGFSSAIHMANSEKIAETRYEPTHVRSLMAKHAQESHAFLDAALTNG